MKKNHSWPHTVRLIIFASLLGGAAGVLTTALTTNYLSEYALELGEITEPLRLTQERPRVLPKDYEDALARLEERALMTVGRLFETPIVDQAGRSIFAQGVPVIALTSDGWALAPVARVGDNATWGVASCEIDQVIPEPLFGFSFVHCAVSNVPVVDLAGGYDLAAGDQLFVVSSSGDMVYTTVRRVEWGESVRSSDLPSRRIMLASGERFESGSAAFNIFGELVGVVGEQTDEVIPFEYLSGAFRQVLGSVPDIAYPALGVRAIDISRTVDVSSELSRGLHSGAIIYGTRGIERGGAAANAGLLVGDIILSVDGISVSVTRALDDLIALYSVGETVRLEIDRDGTRQEVSATLGELVL